MRPGRTLRGVPAFLLRLRARDHTLSSSLPPMANKARDCAIEAASPTESGARASGPNCSSPRCIVATITEHRPNAASDLDRLARTAIDDLFLLAMFSLCVLIVTGPESGRSLFVFSLCLIAVVTIGVIALVAIIKSPASVKNVSMRGLQ